MHCQLRGIVTGGTWSKNQAEQEEWILPAEVTPLPCLVGIQAIQIDGLIWITASKCDYQVIYLRVKLVASGSEAETVGAKRAPERSHLAISCSPFQEGVVDES
jgi:hypothetical protein